MCKQATAGKAALLHVSWKSTLFPDYKRSYESMFRGIGYGEDLLVCAALGIDMADCVFPTRTAVSDKYEGAYIVAHCLTLPCIASSRDLDWP
jgi:tRNA-guanine family transglycosylase